MIKKERDLAKQKSNLSAGAYGTSDNPFARVSKAEEDPSGEDDGQVSDENVIDDEETPKRISVNSGQGPNRSKEQEADEVA